MELCWVRDQAVQGGGAIQKLESTELVWWLLAGERRGHPVSGLEGG